MKRYIKAAASINTDLVFKGIKLFNDAYDNHIYLNKDKTAFRYVTYERDFYQFGYVSDLVEAFDRVLGTGQYNIQSDDDLLSAFTDAFEMLEDDEKVEYKGAHHAFETSELNAWTKSKNREYGFNVLSDDEGYATAQKVRDQIVDLCDQYGLSLDNDKIRTTFQKWWVTVKPKLREVKFTGGYGGLGEFFLGYGRREAKKAFIKMLYDNTQRIIEGAGLRDLTINNRTGSIIFHY